MMDGMDSLHDAIDGMQGGPAAEQRVTAVVIGRDEDGTVWAHMPGGARMTPATATVDVSQNDVVSGVVSNNRLIIDRNLTDKSAGGKSVAEAREKATAAMDNAALAASGAAVAQQMAQSATESAAAAAGMVETIEQIEQDAGESLQTILTAAMAAGQNASDALAAANSANESAQAAYDSAQTANLNLSWVEDVVNVLNWVAQHRKETTDQAPVPGKQYYMESGGGVVRIEPYEYALTQDQSIAEGKTYYTYDSETGTYSPVAEPDVSDIATYYEYVAQNPATEGYYELDDALGDFVNAHVTLTDAGLNVKLSDDKPIVHLGTVYTGANAKPTGLYLIDGTTVLDCFTTSGTVIGKESGPHISITANGIDFWAGSEDNAVNKVGYIETTTEGSLFYMTKAVVVKELRFAKWSWMPRDNNNLSLKWMGAGA